MADHNPTKKKANWFLMTLESYKYTYLAGDFIQLDLTLDDSHSSSIVSNLSGHYEPETLKLEGIAISNQNLEFRNSVIWILTDDSAGALEYIALHGAHVMTQSKPRDATKAAVRSTAMSSFEGILDSDEIHHWWTGPPGQKTYNYKYAFYVNQDVDPALRMYTHRERGVGFLQNACAFIKRRGRVNVYESNYSSTYITPMTNPYKIGIYSDIGEGGSLIVENSNKSDLLDDLDNADITAVTETQLFPI